MKFKGQDVPDSKFNKKWLKIGTKIEKEHTDNEEIAKAIAKAHLLESPHYYSELIKMEKKLDSMKKATFYFNLNKENGDFDRIMKKLVHKIKNKKRKNIKTVVAGTRG